MKTTLLIPTINEIAGLRVIAPRIRPEWCDQVLVVDGGSTDGTVEFCRERGYKVISQVKPGMRHAYMESWPHVTGDVVVTFSPDGNSIPELIPLLIARIAEGYDMVIASRYLGNARSEDDNAVTRLANKVFTGTINLLFGGKYTDAMVIYRAYRKDLVGTLGLDRDEPYGFGEWLVKKTMSWEPLLSIRAAKRKLKVGEIPGDEPPRIGGPVRTPWRWGFSYIAQIGREIFKWR